MADEVLNPAPSSTTTSAEPTPHSLIIIPSIDELSLDPPASAPTYAYQGAVPLPALPAKLATEKLHNERNSPFS